MQTIDLNCDLGEGMPDDEILMDYVTSANIACGFHAGDYGVMQHTVNMAIKKGIAIGAHPGLPDLQGFGRREMKISTADGYQLTLYQIGALYAFVKAANGQLNHVKLHGALYNMAAKDAPLAKAVAQAVYDFDPGLILYALSGSEMIKAATIIGLKTASEVFADRSYQSDGFLTPRSNENALLSDDETAIAQVLMMVNEQHVKTSSGKIIPITAETICLHGDGEHAVSFAKKITSKLKANGISLKAPSK